MKGRLLFLVILFGIDRIITRLLLSYKSPLGSSADFLFNPVINRDIAFSLHGPAWTQELLVPLIFLISLALIAYAIVRYKKSAPDFVYWGLVTIGAVSNLIDRVLYGGVVDYIDLHWWPVFNMSDVFITIGIAGLLILELRKRKSV